MINLMESPNVKETPATMADVRIVRLPKSRMVTSGSTTYSNVFSEGGFMRWLSNNDHLLKNVFYKNPDFVCFEGDSKIKWLSEVRDATTAVDTAPHAIVDFEGGLYAVCMQKCGENTAAGDGAYEAIDQWLQTSGFEQDENDGRKMMIHVINDADDVANALGYYQIDVYVPIKVIS